MKYGVVFPQVEFAPDPIAIRDYAQAVEDMGYDYIIVYDHVLGANPNRPGGWKGRPYTYKDSFHEPFVLFGYWAGLTKTIEFVPAVIIMPQRQTVLLAKQAAQVDVFTGGRFRLGVGVGWNEVEYEGLNENFHNRGKRSEEQIVLLRELWTHELVTFKGKYHTISDAGINPLPVQRPIPIWIGGMAEVTLKRMARLADGWFPQGQIDDTMRAMIERLHGYLAAEGRQPETFGLDSRISFSRVPQAEWASEVEAWRQVGATHIAFDTMRLGYTTLDEHLAAIKQFKQEVG